MRSFVWAFAALALSACAATARADGSLRDGTRFDPGAAMTEPAEGAADELDAVAWMTGHWRLDYTRYLPGDSTFTAAGRSDVTFMNRGHGLMERFHCADFDGAGHELNTMSFIVYNAALETWGLGIADSWREDIMVYSGGPDGDGGLVLYDARRPRGGLTLTWYRLTISSGGDDVFTALVETSTDGLDWAPSLLLEYARMDADDGLFTSVDGYGEPAPDLPEEARQFDFLIGEWELRNDLTFPNGRAAQWTADATAVYMLNGHCVMEYSSFDTDPNLPDAATTIVRMWNRQMRRWECMYMNNRFNGILHFGGVKEGDRIVLHQFDADAADVPINQWVFHSWTPEGYGWYGNTSRDRGGTWTKTWIIEATRNEP